MKHWMIFISCMLNVVILCADIASVEKFRAATALYNQKQFDQAYVLLQEINPKSEAVWYNMGNCAYKKNDYEHALSCWRCAGSNASRLENVYYNIDVVEKKLNRTKQESFWNKMYNFYYSMPLIIFQFFFLLPWFLLLLFIKKYKHGTKYRSLFFGVLLFVTMISGIALGFKYHIIKQRKGIVMKPQVSLYAGPDEQFHVLGCLEGASEVIVHEQRPSWCKISTEHGSGWVVRDSIVVV